MGYSNCMYEIYTLPEFDAFQESVKDPIAAAAIATRIDRAALGLLGDRKTVGDGVSEMRVDVGQGYRLYYVLRKRTIVLLLCGSDKRDQERAIKLAKKLAKEN
jgi:putative addiction module killer protein